MEVARFNAVVKALAAVVPIFIVLLLPLLPRLMVEDAEVASRLKLPVSVIQLDVP